MKGTVAIQWVLASEEDLFLGYYTGDSWVGIWDYSTVRNKQYTLAGVGNVLLF